MNVEQLKNWYLRGTRWERLFKLGASVLIILCITLMLYSLYISIKIEKRFSGRRWSIPSKVLSDSTILYPGQRINRELFNEKLAHLGYREVSRTPERPGEMRTSKSALELFLHDLKAPTHGRESFPVKIGFWRNGIDSIVRLDNGDLMPLLELEPEEIALLFGPERERRQLISIDQVPQHLIYAILGAEDKRFYRHHGADPRGILRALLTNIRHGSVRQGGSTITQQLAKCYFLTPKRTLSRKLKELLMSLIIEMKYDKDEILEIYLNEIYLGQRGSVSINGIGEASHFYFGKAVSELSLTEAACIAGLIKAPNHYSPYIDKDRCRDQRDKVLRIMQKNEWISENELHDALASPISTVGFTAFGKKAPYFVDYLLEQLTALYSPEALNSLGLSIYTALDTQVQMAAEKALEDGLARLEQSNPALNRPEPERKLQGAVIVIQPKTGYILAMAGGRDYDVTQFNRIAQARRQPGSAFKPFVFLSSLETLTPASKLSNEPVSFDINGELWEPQNFEPVPEPQLTMRDALARSINLAAIDLAMQVGLDRVADTAAGFQFSTPIRPYPSIALGAFEVIPMELARAYCTFAADGALPYLLSLKEVADENDAILERRHMTIERVISPAQAFVMTSMLRSVMTDGTARSLKARGISFPVAGKTGTTNNCRDAWFIGYTPDILALVWVGFDDEHSIDATGSSAALPIWADLMDSIPQYISNNWFRMPPGVVKRRVCSESGEIAVRGCVRTMEEVFLTEKAPAHYCRLHRGQGSFNRIVEEGKDFLKGF